MSLYLDQEYGIAIDDLYLKDKRKWAMPSAHQIIRLSYNLQNNLVLHYTSYAPHVNNALDIEKFQDFKERFAYYKKHLSVDSRKNAVSSFSGIMDDLNPDRMEGYQAGIGHTSITSDIVFKANRPVSISKRLTTGFMVEQMTPANAEIRAKADPSLFFSKLKQAMIKRSGSKDQMGFKEVSSIVTDWLSKDAMDNAIFDNVGAICRTKRKDNTNRKNEKEDIFYGSTLDIIKDLLEYGGELINRASILFTANRDAIQAINALALSQYNLNMPDKFSNEFLQTVAEYKTLTGSPDPAKSKFYTGAANL